MLKDLNVYHNHHENLILATTTKELGRNVDTGLNKCLDSTKLRNTGFNFLTLEKSFKLIQEQMNN